MKKNTYDEEIVDEGKQGDAKQGARLVFLEADACNRKGNDERDWPLAPRMGTPMKAATS